VIELSKCLGHICGGSVSVVHRRSQSSGADRGNLSNQMLYEASCRARIECKTGESANRKEGTVVEAAPAVRHVRAGPLTQLGKLSTTLPTVPILKPHDCCFGADFALNYRTMIGKVRLDGGYTYSIVIFLNRGVSAGFALTPKQSNTPSHCLLFHFSFTLSIK
jgi:hypothetical protein